jgi:hypothetical protein
MTDAETSRLTVDREHPFLGLASFEEEHSLWFHGRGDEREELIRLVRRDLLTVLFGLSGLGKTSLLNAGLFPWLRENRFLPIRIRLAYGPDAPDLTEQVRRAIAAAISEHGIDASPPGGETLWEYFHANPFWDSRSRLLTPVLVLDQLEEIFTLGADDPSRDAFFTQLSDLAENRIPAAVARRLETSEEGLPFAYDRSRLKLILSLREDFLADLEDLRPRMPALARNRFRLAPLNGEQAFEAVCRPGGDLLTPKTAARIVRFVGTGRRRGRHLKDLSVEPALLSLVCRELNNRRLSAGAAAITPDLLQVGQGEILAEFYRRSIAGLDPGVQRLIEDQLLTASGFRATKSLDDALAMEGVTPEAIRTLVDGRLLRQEARLGTPHLELIHDVLAPVVCESRDRRRGAGVGPGAARGRAAGAARSPRPRQLGGLGPQRHCRGRAPGPPRPAGRRRHPAQARQGRAAGPRPRPGDPRPPGGRARPGRAGKQIAVGWISKAHPPLGGCNRWMRRARPLRSSRCTGGAPYPPYKSTVFHKHKP